MVTLAIVPDFDVLKETEASVTRVAYLLPRSEWRNRPGVEQRRAKALPRASSTREVRRLRTSSQPPPIQGERGARDRGSMPGAAFDSYPTGRIPSGGCGIAPEKRFPPSAS